MRLLRRLGVPVLGTAILAAGPASARGGATWTSLGPPGGTVDVVAAAPSLPTTVYAGSKVGGVFASTDSGQTWRIANAGLSDRRVGRLAVSPADPGVVYAGTPSGIFKTTDGGGSWSAASSGLPSGNITTIAIDPSTPDTVYAAGPSGIVAKSTNGGGSWTSVGNATTATAQPAALAVNPSSPRTIFLGTLQSGVFRSDDGGTTWTARNNGLADVLGNTVTDVSAVAVDPTSPTRVYAGTADAFVFRSEDSGATWNPYPGAIGSTYVVSIAVASDGTAFLAQKEGIVARGPTDGAWASMPFVSSYVNGISVPGGQVPLYAAYGQLPFDTGGFGRWDGGGEFLTTALPLLVVAAIAPDPASPERAIVATTAQTFVYEPGTAVGPWSPPFANGGVANGLQSNPIAVFFDPRTPGLVYAGGGGLILRSTDGGTSNWVATPGIPATAIPTVTRCFGILPGTSQGMLAGTSTGLYQSSDGTSWSAGSADLSARQVWALGGDASTTVLWAGTDAGVYRSGDAGAHWTPVSGGPSGLVRAVRVSGTGAVIAGGDAGLFVSTDGTSWAPASGVSGVVYGLGASAVSGELAAGGGAGVSVSADGGAHWSAEAQGLTNPNVISLGYLTDGTLLAGTNGGSVFVRTVTEDREGVSRAPAPAAPRELAPR